MILNTWTTVLAESFKALWFGFLTFVPNLVIAIIIFVVGWVVAVAVSKVVAQLIRLIKVDTALRAAGVEDVVRRAGFNLDAGKFLGEIVKYFVIVSFLVASFEVLGLVQVNDFLQTIVVGFLPQVIVAVLILLVAAVIAEFVKKVVVAGAKAAGLSYAHLLSAVANWAIWIFAIIAALVQLNIAAPLFQTLFTGIVIAISLALGLSFGLGGQQAAAHFIEKVKNDISDR